MAKHWGVETTASGFEAGSAYSSIRPVTALPGMHEGKIRTRYDEDTSYIQQEKGENGNEAKRCDKREKAEPFIFSDPSSRWFEFNEMADRLTSRRIDKHANLRNLSGIYKIKDKFAEEVATKLVRKESENKVLFTKTEARKFINACINLRIRTWLDILDKQGLAAYIASSGTVVEMNENGEIVDYSEVNTEWGMSEDRENPFHRDPLEVIIAREEEQVLERALAIMASKRTLRAKEYMAIIAILLDRPDLADCTILNGLTNSQKNILTFHAIRTLSRIVEKLYPVTKPGKGKRIKVKRTPFKVLKELMRKTPALWKEEDFNEAA